MLTPAFELAQDDVYLIVTIHAPYTKISEAEVYFHETDFKFYSKPYFLRLNLPGKVIENGSEKASYDSDKGTFVLHVPKLTSGENFEGLELITKFLAPKKKVVLCSPIEIINSDGANSDADLTEFDDFDWEIEQIPYMPEENLTIENAKYGFANQYSGIVSRFEDELNEMIDVRMPDQKSIFQRHEERLKAEEEQFSDNHYLGDLYEDEEIQRLLVYQPNWSLLHTKLKDNPSFSPSDFVKLTDEEKEKMRKLPNKDYLVDHVTKCQLLFSLVDLLFSYAYNVRTTEGENTVESVWTLRKLSATLSWFESYSCLEAAVVSSMRRSLCYPLYRHWGLATTLLNDLQQILGLGTKYVIKCLLSIHELMNKTDPHYILNDMYITDYCVWVQTLRSETFFSLSQAIKKLNITKKSVNLDLMELEKGAELALKEENTSDSESYDASTSSSSSLDSADQDQLCAGVNSMAITNSGIRQAANNSETETSDDSTTTDSDDFSSSSDEYSSNSDDDSTDNSTDNLLLRKEKCPERER